MVKGNVTSPRVAGKDSKALRGIITGTESISTRSSALSKLVSTKKNTSRTAISVVSSILRGDRTNKTSKFATGSTLTQRQKRNDTKVNTNRIN